MINTFSVGPIATQVYLIEKAGQPLVIVDPGDDAGLIHMEAQKALKRSNTGKVYIVCTHGHLDHIAAIPELLQLLKDDKIEVSFYAPEGDSAYFGPSAAETHRRVLGGIGASSFFEMYWREIPEPDFWYGDGFVFPESEMVAIHTPGHSPGSSCLLYEGCSVLVSGDTLFRGGRGRTDCFDSDERAILQSIREKLCILPDATRIWPGHGGPSTIGREKIHYI